MLKIVRKLDAQCKAEGAQTDFKCKVAGLRNTFITTARNVRGIPGNHVSMLVNHKLPRNIITDHYDVGDFDELAISMKMIAERFKELGTAIEPPSNVMSMASSKK